VSLQQPRHLGLFFRLQMTMLLCPKPQPSLTPFSIFNSGTYGGGNCQKSDCNGITMNGGSLTMTSVEVRNNQVSQMLSR
jgi:hypothetical protein